MVISLREWPYRKVAIAVLLLLLLSWAYYILPLKILALQVSQWMESQGLMGIMAYAVIFVIATLVLFPCAFLTFAAGLAYGIWGVPLVLVATCIGATFAFLISRHFVKEKVDEYMNKKRGTRALKQAIEQEGWKFMILLRMSPLIPFNLNNYFLGTIQVRFFTYMWVTALGALPGTFLYVYLGSLGKSIEDVRESQWALLALGFLATLALTRMTLKKTKSFLKQDLV